MHYYQFNIGDYKSHTEHLSDYEDLAYRRMLDWCYLHEKPLPNDVEEIARHIRLRSHTDCIAVVLREFFIQSPEGWVNSRVLQEIARTGEKSSKARESALARWTRAKDANALPTDSERNATQDTIHKTHNTEKTPQKRLDCPPEVNQKVWFDFVAHRKHKRAAITETALTMIANEAKKAGWPLEKALVECINRGWTGFKAEWVTNQLDKPRPNLFAGGI